MFPQQLYLQILKKKSIGSILIKQTEDCSTPKSVQSFKMSTVVLNISHLISLTLFILVYILIYMETNFNGKKNN